MIVLGIAIAFTLFALRPANAQNLSRITPSWLGNSSTIENTQVVSAAVRLDGRDTFVLAAPAPLSRFTNQTPQGSPTAVRIQGIEMNLRRWVNRKIDPQTLTIRAAIDSQSNLPVITINQQYLMTVTTLDAELQGQTPIDYANELTKTIRYALVQAQQERQPGFLIRQTGIAITVVLGVLLLNWGLARLQKRLQQQKKYIQANTPTLADLPAKATEMDGTQTRLRVQQHLNQREQSSLKSTQQRFIQLIQFVLWASGVSVIVGLFPDTRGLRPFLLSTPLIVISIIFLTFLLLRITDVMIDRIFKTFEAEKAVTPDTSQRLALRVSTFSRVMKSLAAILWLCLGTITILSVIGIQILPLLAGAGIVGLGISLASQSLIKDVINGCLILFEDQYAVGDVIRVGSVSGLVEYLSLRSTRIRSSEGNLITLPNSAISIVENLSKEWSRVDLAITVSYEVDVDRAIEVINQVGQRILQDPHWQTKILEPPEVLGVDNLDSTGLTLRIWIKTQPLQQWNVGRDFRRRLKLAFDQQGIAIGVPQQSLSVRSALDERSEAPARPQD
jgi:moderate conductance mechanosensitive channel